MTQVSIRYNAVLGNKLSTRRLFGADPGRFQSAITRYLETNPYWESARAMLWVSIRYNAVLGNKLLVERISQMGNWVSIRYNAVLGNKPTTKTGPVTSGGASGLHTTPKNERLSRFASSQND